MAADELDAMTRELAVLVEERRTIAASLDRLRDGPPPADELLLRRLKRRLTGLDERIGRLQRLLAPDMPA